LYPHNTWFLAHASLFTNDISAGSAVFVGLISVTNTNRQTDHAESRRL